MTVKVGVLLSGRASCRMYKALGWITSTPKQSKTECEGAEEGAVSAALSGCHVFIF